MRVGPREGGGDAAAEAVAFGALSFSGGTWSLGALGLDEPLGLALAEDFPFSLAEAADFLFPPVAPRFEESRDEVCDPRSIELPRRFCLVAAAALAGSNATETANTNSSPKERGIERSIYREG